MFLCIMIQRFRYTVAELVPYIDWAYFFHAWQVKGDSEQGVELKEDALQRLMGIASETGAEALYRQVKAYSEGDDIVIKVERSKSQKVEKTLLDPIDFQTIKLPMLRQQRLGADGVALCLADFVQTTADSLGIFATTSALSLQTSDITNPYESLMMQTLATRLAEAAAEKLDEETRRMIEKSKSQKVNGAKGRGIRPAIGYPSLPDLSVNFLLDELIEMKSIGITLTENGAMDPPSSVSGLIIRHPAARYFSIGSISEEQFEDYTRRRGLTSERMRQFLRAVL